MSTLKDRLRADRDEARRDGKALQLSTLNLVLGEIETREKSGKTPVELTSAQVEAVLRKEATKRRETASIYADADEPGRAERETAEAQVLEAYLPKMLTEDEVVEIIESLVGGQQITAGGNPSDKPVNFGMVMKAVQAKVAGRFDGKKVAALVKARLG